MWENFQIQNGPTFFEKKKTLHYLLVANKNKEFCVWEREILCWTMTETKSWMTKKSDKFTIAMDTNKLNSIHTLVVFKKQKHSRVTYALLRRTTQNYYKYKRS